MLRGLLKVSKHTDREAALANTNAIVPVEIPFLAYGIQQEADSIARLTIELSPYPDLFNFDAYFQDNQLLIAGIEIFAGIREVRIDHSFGGESPAYLRGGSSIYLRMEIIPCEFFSDLPSTRIAVSRHPPLAHCRLPRFEHSASGQMVVVHDGSPPPNPSWLDERERLMQSVRSLDSAITALRKPKACLKCIHYHGSTYSGRTHESTQLICGMHPFGPEGETCPDHEAEKQSPVVHPYIAATESVRERLGLQPFDEFAARAGNRRRSGRTTKTLCQALAYAETGGTALIVVRSQSLAKLLCEQMGTYRASLGIDPARIYISTDATLLRGHEHNIFIDHTLLGEP